MKKSSQSPSKDRRNNHQKQKANRPNNVAQTLFVRYNPWVNNRELRITHPPRFPLLPPYPVVAMQSPQYAKLYAYFQQYAFKDAISLISQCEKVADAEHIIDLVLSYLSADCWLALLNNPALCEAININQLNTLVIKANSYIECYVRRNATPPTELTEVMLQIAKNLNFCRQLGYNTILNYAKLNPTLGLYIATSLSFLLQLDPMQIEKLLIEQPQYTAIVLNVLAGALQDHINEHIFSWAKSTFMHLFICAIECPKHLSLFEMITQSKQLAAHIDVNIVIQYFSKHPKKIVTLYAKMYCALTNSAQNNLEWIDSISDAFLSPNRNYLPSQYLAQQRARLAPHQELYVQLDEKLSQLKLTLNDKLGW